MHSFDNEQRDVTGPAVDHATPTRARRVRIADRGISDTKMADTVGARIRPVDPYPDRDLDHTRITRDIAAVGAIVSVTVPDTPEIRAASDHLPRRLRLSRARLPRTAA